MANLAPHVLIQDRRVGPGSPALLVAEMSANHDGSLATALELLRAAKAAGADAVKLQHFTPESVTLDVDLPGFTVQDGSAWHGRRLFELYRQAMMPWEWTGPLVEEARRLGLIIFSTPSGPEAVDVLERHGMPAYKVASFELQEHDLLRAVARTGKPVILSTGMASLADIAESVEVLRAAGCEELVLLRCVSAYPAPADEMRLRTIPHLAATFGVVAGLSDHTLGNDVAVAAVAVGASLIEKHVTLSRAAGGLDSSFSIEPHELRALVDSVRTVEAALGEVGYGPGATEEASRAYRRSLYFARDLRAGEPIGEADVRSIRPGYGLHPRFRPEVVGRRVTRDVTTGTPVSWDVL